jgi:aconitate hydratase
MIKINPAACYTGGKFVESQDSAARNRTMAYKILKSHSTGSGGDFHIKFDALASHDITYVGVIQTARASGLTRFPVPYVLTNCHNSLCAVGGTINADDHAFGLSAAKKYGGEFVPAHMAVIHQYMRERYAAGGRMILASDSHTRYGAFGTLAIGEGGPEIVKQLLERTYDLAPPPVWAVHLIGKLNPGVGAQDVALAIIGAVFPKGIVKNCILEFVGSGIAELDMDTRS